MNSWLTICYVTSREEPLFDWFFDSLFLQCKRVVPDIIVVDFYRNSRGPLKQDRFPLTHVAPKPTVWQGPHRLTKEDWWAKSNALNTGIALCKTEWIAFLDDRSFLLPGWVDAIIQAENSNHGVVGSYEKRYGMEVEKGIVTNLGAPCDGGDIRRQDSKYRTGYWYGGSGAVPLEWCLTVNGFSEDLADGIGSEDIMFGACLRNSGYPFFHDPNMKILEDRTPSQIGGALKRADKGVSPNDKSHVLKYKFDSLSTSQNSYSLRDLRNKVLSGEPFPPPSAPPNDWYDNEPLAEMT